MCRHVQVSSENYRIQITVLKINLYHYRITDVGRMAERLCRGLQILGHRFDSGSGLHRFTCFHVYILLAILSGSTIKSLFYIALISRRRFTVLIIAFPANSISSIVLNLPILILTELFIRLSVTPIALRT